MYTTSIIIKFSTELPLIIVHIYIQIRFKSNLYFLQWSVCHLSSKVSVTDKLDTLKSQSITQYCCIQPEICLSAPPALIDKKIYLTIFLPCVSDYKEPMEIFYCMHECIVLLNISVMGQIKNFCPARIFIYMDVCMMCDILPLGAWICTSGCNKEVAALFDDSCRKIQQLLYTMHYFCSVEMQAYILPAHAHILFCIIIKFVRGSCIYLVTCTLYSSAVMYILDFTVACIQFSQLSTLVVLHLLLAGFPLLDLLHPGQTLPPFPPFPPCYMLAFSFDGVLVPMLATPRLRLYEMFVFPKGIFVIFLTAFVDSILT